MSTTLPIVTAYRCTWLHSQNNLTCTCTGIPQVYWDTWLQEKKCCSCAERHFYIHRCLWIKKEWKINSYLTSLLELSNDIYLPRVLVLWSCLSLRLSVCRLSVCMSVYLSVYLSVSLSTCQSFYLSVVLLVCLSIRLSVSLSLGLSLPYIPPLIPLVFTKGRAVGCSK